MTIFPFSHSQPIELTVFQEPELVVLVPVPWEIPFILHRIPAGFPSPAAEYEEKELDFNRYLVANLNATFVFTVVGDSMQGIGIMDGCKVTVDRSIPPKHGHIVLAVVNGDFTIKRFYKRGGKVELRAENPKFEPIRFGECDELTIWGVVTGCVTKFTV